MQAVILNRGSDGLLIVDLVDDDGARDLAILHRMGFGSIAGYNRARG